MTKISLGTGLFLKSKPDEDTSGLLPSLVYDVNTGEVFKSFAGSDLYSNGLTRSNRIVKLGGTLIEDTTIDGGLYDFNLNSTNLILGENSTFALLNSHAKDYVLTSDTYGNGTWKQLLVCNLLNGLTLTNGTGFLGGELINETLINLNSNKFIINGKNIPFIIGTGFNGSVYSCIEQSDGKLVIGGDFTSFNDIPINKLARLNSDGSLDQTFNTGGTGFNGEFYVRTIIQQTDGKILVGGGTYGTYNGVALTGLIRLNKDGSVDESFTIPTLSSIRSIVQQDNGKILVGGTNLLRLNVDGTLDTDFNTNIGSGFGGGRRFTAIFAIAEDFDGTILVGGDYTTFNGTPNYNLIRLNNDGTVNQSFDSKFDGVLPDYSTIRGIIVEQGSTIDSSSIVVYGNFLTYDSVSHKGFLRLKRDATVDDTTTVIGSGFEGSLSSSNTGPYKILRLSNGDYLCSGFFTSYNGTACPGLIKINKDGTIDTTFDAGTGFGGGGVINVNLLRSGKFLFLGSFTSYNSVSYNCIIRITQYGNIDNISGDYYFTFNGDGSIYSNYLQGLVPTEIGSYIGIDTDTGLLKLMASTNSLPIATNTVLGGVTIGSTLDITEEGLLNTKLPSYKPLSYNGSTSRYILSTLISTNGYLDNITSDITLELVNLSNGVSGDIILKILTTCNITLYNGGYINGTTTNLSIGKYHLCYTYDGTDVYWNIAKYISVS